MANSISSVTTGTGGIVLESVDTSGNTNIKSGTTTIVAVTSTGAAVTGTLSASGGIAKASLPTGSVLQVVNATYSTQVSTTTTTYVDTGLTATITPTSATSKILVIVDHADVFKNTGNTGCGQQLLRGASILAIISKYAADNNSTVYGMVGGCGINYLDSPATTSATTYKTQINSTQNVANAGINFQNSTSTITLMEIAA